MPTARRMKENSINENEECIAVHSGYSNKVRGIVCSHGTVLNLNLNLKKQEVRRILEVVLTPERDRSHILT